MGAEVRRALARLEGAEAPARREAEAQEAQTVAPT
jgi:hypothetical protein